MTLFYLPLEPYQERYTLQWSAPKTGWLERQWIKAGINYMRINGDDPGQRSIKAGVVLDTTRRCKFAMSQVSKLLDLIDRGLLTSDDTIYFDDFWHPGMESLPYCFDIYGIQPRVFCFLHAQSVDQYDFTSRMQSWMRHYEVGQSRWLTGIFTSCPTLATLIEAGFGANPSKIYPTGHPFCSEEVRERMPKKFPHRRDNTVVWSSRWDKEKQPDFFMKVAQTVMRTDFPSPCGMTNEFALRTSLRESTTKFIVCTGSEKLRSNDPELVRMAYDLHSIYPHQFIIKEGLTKEQYYAELVNAKVHFNCALQDFVAISLLEASVAGCYPIYPFFRSFPETFRYNDCFMYKPWEVNAAAGMILRIIECNTNLWSPEQLIQRAWIHERFDTVWRQQLNIMQGLAWESPWQ